MYGQPLERTPIPQCWQGLPLDAPIKSCRIAIFPHQNKISTQMKQKG